MFILVTDYDKQNELLLSAANIITISPSSLHTGSFITTTDGLGINTVQDFKEIVSLIADGGIRRIENA